MSSSDICNVAGSAQGAGFAQGEGYAEVVEQQQYQQAQDAGTSPPGAGSAQGAGFAQGKYQQAQDAGMPPPGAGRDIGKEIMGWHKWMDL